MSVATVKTAWTAFLGAAPFSLPVYWRRMPLPYVTGTPLPDGTVLTALYPFGVLRPGTQTKRPITGGEVQQAGFYHLLYVEQMGARYQSAAAVEDAASTFADLLGDTLAASFSNRQLNSPSVIFGAGWEQGVIARYDEARWARDDQDQEAYALPIDIWTAEAPQSGA